jgi:hypothetical protein
MNSVTRAKVYSITVPMLVGFSPWGIPLLIRAQSRERIGDPQTTLTGRCDAVRSPFPVAVPFQNRRF